MPGDPISSRIERRGTDRLSGMREDVLVQATLAADGLARLVRARGLLALIAIGLVVRLAYFLYQPTLDGAVGEAKNVAVTLAETGRFANPFGVETGDTAHLTPSMSFVAGMIYRLFGTPGVAAETVLALLSITIVCGGAYLFARAWQRAGLPDGTALGAVALFAVLPLNLQLETVSFRVWEGALAVLCGALMLFACVRHRAGAALTTREMLPLAAIPAVTLFVNPAMGLATYACLGWLVLTSLRFAAWPRMIALSIVAFALVFGPWALRNRSVFSELVLLRSNPGLELALANNDRAYFGADARVAFLENLRAIHPLEMGPERARQVLAGGERAYAKRLGATFGAWLRAHPDRFAALAARHWVQFYFPPAWQWDIYAPASRMTALKVAVTWAISILGLLGALMALLAWRGAYIYVALLALVPSLPYVVVQPVLRYRYLVLLPLLFLGVELVRRLLARRRRA